jgi:hypothetical protein
MLLAVAWAADAEHQSVSLTPVERRFLEHSTRPQKEGVALPDYYRSYGLSPCALYHRSAQADGKRDAAAGTCGTAEEKKPSWPASFVAATE